MGVEGKSDLEVVLEMFDLRKALRIGAWVARFLHSSRDSTNKAKGPLSPSEVTRHETFFKRAQQQGFNNVSLEQDQEQLNLQPNEEGVLECRGRSKASILCTCRTRLYLRRRLCNVPI